MKNITITLSVVAEDSVDEYDVSEEIGYMTGVSSVDVVSSSSESMEPRNRVVCHAVGCDEEFPYDGDFIRKVDSYDDAVEYIHAHPDSQWEVSEQPGVTRGNFYCPTHAYHEPFVINHSKG
jgi:hypothetical protein